MEDSANEIAVEATGRSSQEHYDVFISYRRDNSEDIARCIEYWFSTREISCFIDVRSIGAGEYEPVISSAIGNSEYFLVLITEGTFESDWVIKEIEEAKATHDSRKIIPVSIEKKYSECEWLKGIQGFVVHRGKSFESDLESLVKDGMPSFRGVLAMHGKGTDRLLSSIRWYKRNDGKITADEMVQINKSAQEIGIRDQKLNELIEQVNKEWEEEQAFVSEVIMPYYEHGDREVDLGEHKDLQKAAERHRIKLDRLNELILMVKAKRTERSKTRKRFWIGNLLACCLLVVGLAWWHGRGVGDGEADGRNAKLIAQLKAEVKKSKQDADGARSSAEKAKQDVKEAKAAAEKLRLAAEKRAAVSSLAREQAEKETRDVRTKLDAALESVAASDAARQDAASQLVKLKATLDTERAERAKNETILDNRRREALDSLAREQAARKEAEIRSAERASELERANEKIRVLEAERLRLQKELETTRERKQLEADRDVI